MKKIFLLLMVFSIFAGCEQLKGPKGDKGDKGDTGLIGTKTYTGTPTSNPYNVFCSEITDLSKQVVSVYAVNGDTFLLLPLTDPGDTSVSPAVPAAVHYYAVTGNLVQLASYFSDGTVPTKALMDYDGIQVSYKIIIKNFTSAPAKQQYLSEQYDDKPAYEKLLVGW